MATVATGDTPGPLGVVLEYEKIGGGAVLSEGSTPHRVVVEA